MGTYLIRRLLHSLLVMWGAITFLFLLLWIIPGDITTQTGDIGRQQSPAVKANLDRLYGLDQPIHMQYLKSLRRIVTFDFGMSATNREISTMLKESFANSARLTFWGVLTYCTVGVITGVYSAVKRNGIFDRSSGAFTILLNALPPFVMGILLQFGLGVMPGPLKWNWPQWTRFPVQWDLGEQRWLALLPLGGTWRTLILPVITIASVESAGLARGSRSVMLEVLRADYLRTARAKGLGERTVLFKHGLRNAFIPIITSIGLAIPNTFGYAVLTETVWNIPGLGGTISQAVGSQDTATVLAFCSVIVLITVVITLMVDLLYGFIDPRVKVE
jgi:ABC-type dipeptide/oligopeptide/nickel transport system permease component